MKKIIYLQMTNDSLSKPLWSVVLMSLELSPAPAPFTGLSMVSKLFFFVIFLFEELLALLTWELSELVSRLSADKSLKIKCIEYVITSLPSRVVKQVLNHILQMWYICIITCTCTNVMLYLLDTSFLLLSKSASSLALLLVILTSPDMVQYRENLQI